MSPLCNFCVAIALLVVLSTRVFAEVADKVPSVRQIWISVLILGIVGATLVFVRWWLGIIAQVIGILKNLLPAIEWNDPFVGEDIARELGANYGMHAYGSIALLGTCYLVSWVLYYLKLKYRSSHTS